MGGVSLIALFMLGKSTAAGANENTEFRTAPEVFLGT